jgi:hypothetical protein
LNGEALTHWGLSRQKQTKHWYIEILLCVVEQAKDLGAKESKHFASGVK